MRVAHYVTPYKHERYYVAGCEATGSFSTLDPRLYVLLDQIVLFTTRLSTGVVLVGRIMEGHVLLCSSPLFDVKEIEG